MAYEPQYQSGNADRTISSYGRLLAWLTTQGERAGNVLMYSSAYLAFVAIIEVTVVMAVLSLPPSLAPVVGGLVTFAVYANDRLADADTDAVSNPQQAAFVRRHRDVLYVLASLSYGVGLALSVLGGPLALAITLLPGLVWVLYASGAVPAIGRYFRRLKDHLVVNTAVVALAWAVSLTFLPLAFADAPVTPAVGVVFAYFFLRSFVDTELPNVHDIEADRAIDVATIPVVFGVRRTRQVLYGVDLLTASLVGFAAVAGYLSTALAGALLVGLVYSLGVTSFVGRIDDEELLAHAVEFEYVVVAVALAPVVFGL